MDFLLAPWAATAGNRPRSTQDNARKRGRHISVNGGDAGGSLADARSDH